MGWLLMGFKNSVETIIRKSNGNVLNFYIKNESLFFRKFITKEGWTKPQLLFKNTSKNKFNINLDSSDLIYGIASNVNGEVFYIFSENGSLNKKMLFEFNKDKYQIIYPKILKSGKKIHLTYYLQDTSSENIWAIINHYFDGNEWHQSRIDIITSNPVINPFCIDDQKGLTTIFYIKKFDEIEEIIQKEFDSATLNWINKKQITFTKNRKLYLDILGDVSGIYHLTWSEFVNENLVVKYKKFDINNDDSTLQHSISLSDPSNCTFPTIIKTNKTLWIVWLQMNKLYYCHSLDNGNKWSSPKIDSKSLDSSFIRYNFRSNYSKDITNFKLNTTFGTYNPSISFIGFKNAK